MVKKIKYAIVALTVFSAVSCNDWLDLFPPSGLIRDDFWKSKEDVEAVLMASYETFAALDRSLFVFGEIRADMVKGDVNQSQSEELIMEGNIYPDNSICNWRTFYTVINYTNEVIKNAPLVQEIDNTFTDFYMKSILAEAYFLRSLCYFYLVRTFKEVPLLLEPSESDKVDFYISKSSEEEILVKIIDDLTVYRPFAPSDAFATDRENKGRASKAAFDALLADIALWMFDYNKVIEYVERIEATEDYFLLPGENWFELFYPGNSLESIFEFQFDGNKNQNNNTYGLTNRLAYQYDPSQKAIEMFGYEEGSGELIRGQDVTIKKYGPDDFIIWKYVGRAPDGLSARSGAEQRSCNWIVYRYADVLLMKAEALSQLERYADAYDIIDVIRARAGVGAVAIANNPVAYEDAIMHERALELAYEGKRWFDLLRMGRRNNYARKNKLIEIIVENVPSTQKRILSVKLSNPLGWYLPVYEREIERNRNLVQNPFYNY